MTERASVAPNRGQPSERSPAPWPDEIRLSEDKRTLTVAFPGGERFALPAEYLRVESPSAEVQGHGPGERRILGGHRRATIRAVEPVGNYAVRLVFADGHETGIYTWAYLATLGREREARWAGYVAALAERGLDRDRPGSASASE